MAKEITVIEPIRREVHSSRLMTDRLRVAAYCRVSTEQEEQQSSFENQVTYYTQYINNRPDYVMAGIYADEGITGTNTKKREQFKRLIADCEQGKIDLIIVKSISRFARNTQDCLAYSRKLKELGIGVMFEKENINTLDGSGELLFTILSSLAQEESRSISENVRWGIRSNFKDGKVHINAERFLGYTKDKSGQLIIDDEQAVIVKRIFEEFMDGSSPDVIAARLNKEEIKGCLGEPRWACSTIWSILSNEKYMGDALLQKYYTADFLTKKTEKNGGELVQYRVQNDHEPIINRRYWEAVQLEIDRRKQYMEQYGLRTMGRYTDEQPFTNRVICGKCNHIFWRRTFTRKTERFKVWLCGQRYREKGVVGCASKTIKEQTLHSAFIKAWNQIADNREDYLQGWKEQQKGDNPLLAFRAKQMMMLTKTHLTEIDLSLVAKVLDYCVVYGQETIEFHFLDLTAISADITG